MAGNVPIIISIYSRPDLAKQVLDAVSIYKPKKIYVIADGPKCEHDIDNCYKTRNVIETIDWDCDVRKKYSENNLGPGFTISSGITWAFGSCDRAIILEEDCIPHSSFFQYCEELLERYLLNQEVGLITGTTLLDNSSSSESYYFSCFPHLWGWATWKRFWDNYSYTMDDWQANKNTQLIKEIIDSKYYSKIWVSNFNQVIKHQIDTWDYQAIYLLWKNKQLGIVPKENLVRNVGFDTRSAHTKRPNKLFNSLKFHQINFPLVHPNEIRRNLSNDKRYLPTLYGEKPSLTSIMIGKLYRFYKKTIFYRRKI